MIEMNLNKDEPKPKTEEDLEEAPVPTYEAWLDEAAKEITGHPLVAVFKGVVGFIRYLQTREQLLIQVLQQKSILPEHEVEEFFGDKAHKEAQDQVLKSLTRKLMQAASQGKLPGPDGKPMPPDSVLVILNDLLDLNDTGWDGRSLEVVAELCGRKELPAEYEKEVASIKQLNELKATRRKQIVRNEELRKEREQKDKEECERKVRIYVSRCRVTDIPEPSEEQQQKMRDGETPIPEVL